MYLTMGELVVMALLGGIGLYAYSAIGVRELALRAVRAASQRDDFQWLDQAVHIQRVSLSRDAKGHWRVWRQYRFEYSYDGVQRSRGFVIMLGRQLQTVVVADPERTLH
ncbi:MAG: DUF3301 domain-containing protein [Halioglobus sp.]|nr:DUF3301 domain-containing protein [Halioglobus sp.]